MTTSRPDRRPVRAAIAAVAIVCGLGTGAAGCAPPGSTAPAAESACDGWQIDRTAPVVSRGEVVVQAPVEAVFALQNDVARWPTWLPSVSEGRRLDTGPPRPGSVFRRTTSGLTAVSTYRAVDTNHCTYWDGPAAGIDGRHLWTYTPVPGGVRVATEESWSGPPVAADPARAQGLLDTNLAGWRDALKRTVESAR